jgi:hypothetical protein
MQIRMASAQIHLIGVPCVMIGEEPSAAPNGGSANALPGPFHHTA